MTRTLPLRHVRGHEHGFSASSRDKLAIRSQHSWINYNRSDLAQRVVRQSAQASQGVSFSLERKSDLNLSTIGQFTFDLLAMKRDGGLRLLLRPLELH